MIFGNNPPIGPVEWMVVGLGNPGSQYAQTRHNAGFRTLDAVAEKAGAKVNRLRFQGQTGVGELAGKRYCF